MRIRYLTSSSLSPTEGSDVYFPRYSRRNKSERTSYTKLSSVHGTVPLVFYQGISPSTLFFTSGERCCRTHSVNLQPRRSGPTRKSTLASGSVVRLVSEYSLRPNSGGSIRRGLKDRVSLFLYSLHRNSVSYTPNKISLSMNYLGIGRWVVLYNY